MERTIHAAVYLVLLATSCIAFGDEANSQTASASAIFTVSGEAGGGHEGVDALKAEIASLTSKLENAETGRSYLQARVREVLEESRASQSASSELAKQNAELSKSLNMVTDSRDYFSNELDSLKKVSNENEQLDGELQRALKGREFLSRQSNRNRIKLMEERKENARLSLSLDRAQQGRKFLSKKFIGNLKELKQSKKALEQETLALEQEKAESARLALALERALLGRGYYSDLVKEKEAEVLAAKKETDQLAEVSFAQINSATEQGKAALEQEKAESARLALALERALLGRGYYSDLVKEKEAEVLAAKKETDQIAEVSFVQINSAIAEATKAKQMLGSTDWADNLSAGLTAAFADLDGTEVTSHSNNSVAIKVGNTGLFRRGGTVLSNSGQRLLATIGKEIADRGDSNIKIVGHTDNIPTGADSRFASNNELSLARAASALSYMTGFGIPAERLSASGVGDISPVATNDTEAGRTANRRVEIILTSLRN